MLLIKATIITADHPIKNALPSDRTPQPYSCHPDHSLFIPSPSPLPITTILLAGRTFRMLKIVLHLSKQHV